MIVTPLAVHQRSHGTVLLHVGRDGLSRMRESGSAKVRYLRAGNEAILINTGGGLAGGDQFAFDIEVAPGASLTMSTQAAERVYRSLGSPATVDVNLVAGHGSKLFWLPQESILYDGAVLNRRIDAEVAPGASFLAVESIILGRAAMGETVARACLQDRWRIHQKGRLVFADVVAFDGMPPDTPATLGNARAVATVVLISDQAGALVDHVRSVIGDAGGASAWSGKLVARFAARDGFELRKALIPALAVLAQGKKLPKVWSL